MNLPYMSEQNPGLTVPCESVTLYVFGAVEYTVNRKFVKKSESRTETTLSKITSEFDGEIVGIVNCHNLSQCILVVCVESQGVGEGEDG